MMQALLAIKKDTFYSYHLDKKDIIGGIQMLRVFVYINVILILGVIISCDLIFGPDYDFPDNLPELSLPFLNTDEIDHIGSIYGQLINFGDHWGPHNGVDIVGKMDGTSVVAASSGVVDKIIWDSEYDNTYVAIQGSKNHLVVYIFEPARDISVEEGEEVQRGQIIGTLSMREGKTGQCCLHFGVKLTSGDIWICPVQFFSQTLIDQLCSIYNPSSPWYDPAYPNLCTCGHGNCSSSIRTRLQLYIR